MGAPDVREVGVLPVLPIVDLLILMGSGSLLVGFVLKSIALATHYRPHILGLTSVDFALMAAICFGMALVLAARTWLKLNEPDLLALRSRLRLEEAHRRAIELEQANHAAPHASEMIGAERPRPR